MIENDTYSLRMDAFSSEKWPMIIWGFGTVPGTSDRSTGHRRCKPTPCGDWRCRLLDLRFGAGATLEPCSSGRCGWEMMRWYMNIICVHIYIYHIIHIMCTCILIMYIMYICLLIMYTFIPVKNIYVYLSFAWVYYWSYIYHIYIYGLKIVLSHLST